MISQTMVDSPNGKSKKPLRRRIILSTLFKYTLQANQPAYITSPVSVHNQPFSCTRHLPVFVRACP